MYRRGDRSHAMALTQWGCRGYMLILTHPDRHQRNIVILLLIRCVGLHIIDDSIHDLFYRNVSWDARQYLNLMKW